jgi:hypothetical protein
MLNLWSAHILEYRTKVNQPTFPEQSLLPLRQNTPIGKGNEDDITTT